MNSALHFSMNWGNVDWRMSWWKCVKLVFEPQTAAFSETRSAVMKVLVCEKYRLKHQLTNSLIALCGELIGLMLVWLYVNEIIVCLGVRTEAGEEWLLKQETIWTNFLQTGMKIFGSQVPPSGIFKPDVFYASAQVLGALFIILGLWCCSQLVKWAFM